ncbi:MAG: hypothetical protein R3E68_06600 [Burkholderiaceae bacterium]
MFESAVIFFAIGLVAMHLGVGWVATLAIGLSWVLLAIGLIGAAEASWLEGGTTATHNHAVVLWVGESVRRRPRRALGPTRQPAPPNASQPSGAAVNQRMKSNAEMIVSCRPFRSNGNVSSVRRE